MSACRSPLPVWYPTWESWRLSGAIPAERPKTLPARIPAWAWLCFKERRPQPKPVAYAGCFERPFALLRNPRSGSEVEKTAAAANVGIATFLFNAFEGDVTHDWSVWRAEAEKRGIRCGEWARCYVDADIRRLISIGQTRGSAVLGLNVENEAETTLKPDVVSVQLQSWPREVAIITDLRGYHDASGYHGPDWRTVAARQGVTVGVGESFVNENAGMTPNALVGRLAEQGFKAARPLFGVYQAALPWTADEYLRAWPAGSFGLYCIDDVSPEQIGRFAR